MQYVLVFNTAIFAACLITFVIGAYLMFLSLAVDVKCVIGCTTENNRTKKDRPKAILKLIEFIQLHMNTIQ